jgi:hypothetical protein
MRSKNKDMLMIGGIFGLFGILFGGIGLIAFLSTRSFLKTSIAREGIVIGLNLDEELNSSTYYPIVSFEFEGKEYHFQSNSGSSPPSFHEGEKVRVNFQAENPYEAKLNSFFSLWGLPLIFGFFGVLFSGIGGSILCFTFVKRSRF